MLILEVAQVDQTPRQADTCEYRCSVRVCVSVDRVCERCACRHCRKGQGWGETQTEASVQCARVGVRCACGRSGVCWWKVRCACVQHTFIVNQTHPLFPGPPTIGGSTEAGLSLQCHAVG